MKHDPTKLRLGTKSVFTPALELLAEPISTPIIQSSTFRMETSEMGFEFGKSTQPTSFYSRWGNPTTHVFEQKVALLENAERALAFASGMAAISTTLLSFLGAGDHVVCSQFVYPGTYEFIHRELAKYGVEHSFVDPTKPENWEACIQKNTKLIYLESPDNPLLNLTDIRAVAALAKKHGLITVADNTFASPICQRPIDLGVDLVLHSATKYLSGHSDVVAGVVTGKCGLIDQVWHKQKLLGGCLDPFAAWLLIRGTKTIELRVTRQSENAAKVASYLAEHKRVARVNYPGLKSHPQFALTERQMSTGGAMLSVELKGNREETKRFVEKTRLFHLAVSIGGVESLICHPATMMFAALGDEDLKKLRISPSLVRISVGIEDAEDLIEDLEQALLT